MLATWTAAKSPATCRAYGSDLAAFATWAGASSSDEAVAALLELGPGNAAAAAERWRGAMAELAPRTVARRLSMLRSVVRAAKRQELVAWDLDAAGPTVRGFSRDTRGPRASDVARMIGALEWGARNLGAGAAECARDLAVVLLLHDSGLRRSEVCSLHVRHVDLDGAMVQPSEKGAGGARQWWPVSARCVRALAMWLEHRTRGPGALFVSCRGRWPGRPTGPGLTPSAVYRIVSRRAKNVGLRDVRPHGLRHSAITAIQRGTGDLVLAQRFGRHASPATTAGHYIDAEPEHVRSLVELVASSAATHTHASARRSPRGRRSPVPSHAAQR